MPRDSLHTPRYVIYANSWPCLFLQHFSEKYKKPLWLTEWACHDFPSKQDCTAAEAETFMKTIIEFFRGEGASMVTRWAWFGAFPDMAK